MVDNEFLAVSGVRGVLQWKSDTLDAVWVPGLTPSRTPLSINDGRPWRRGRPFLLLTAASFFDGFNHLPNIEAAPAFDSNGMLTAATIVKRYPTLRMYGVDAAVPTVWFTVKGEAAYFTTSTPATDEYVLYVLQLDRQTGEWLLVGGYAGEAVTRSGETTTFAPDRGLTRSIVARASYTIDPNRSAAFEAAVRQNGRGVYVKGEYSQARGQHWRTTITAALIRGDEDDFLGQYRRNSHVAAALRYSF